VNTIIGKGSEFVGNLKIDGAARIDGKVKGEIKVTDNLVIGVTSEIEADITAKSAVISGKVIGKIFALEGVELQSNSLIIGDITTKNLIIEQGAIFRGKSNTDKNE
jgi:cytoskeletal protein CcmA (bactofilin family)